MPRMARLTVPGEAHHITQRGNRREDVFFDDDDRRRYLELLAEYAAKHELAVLAWCLMSNHVHLVARPAHERSLAGCLGPVHLRYAQHVNWRRGWQGRLWQGRYYSCVLDGPHALAAVRYVERNPVRAGLVARAEEYAWSSAAGHCGLAEDALVTADEALSAAVGAAHEWRDWLAIEPPAAVVDHVRRHTLTGRPAGDGEFVAQLEQQCGQRLTARPVGRPRRGDK